MGQQRDLALDDGGEAEKKPVVRRQRVRRGLGHQLATDPRGWVGFPLGLQQNGTGLRIPIDWAVKDDLVVSAEDDRSAPGLAAMGELGGEIEEGFSPMKMRCTRGSESETFGKARTRGLGSSTSMF